MARIDWNNHGFALLAKGLAASIVTSLGGGVVALLGLASSLPVLASAGGVIATLGGLGAAVSGFGLLAFMVTKLGRLPHEVRLLGDRRFERTFHQILNDDQKAFPIFREALTATMGQIRFRSGPEQRLDWLGYRARLLACVGLKRLKDPRAVSLLCAALVDPDQLIRAKAVEALGEVAECGDEQVLDQLIPLLGNDTPVWPGMVKAATVLVGLEDDELRSEFDAERYRGRSISNLAADALVKLGAGNIADAFARALDRDPGAVQELIGPHRDETVNALILLLDSTDYRASGAAWTLGKLGATSAIPALRSKAGLLSGASSQVRTSCQEALEELSSLEDLPRPSQKIAEIVETLPRISEAGDHHTGDLPRQTSREHL